MSTNSVMNNSGNGSGNQVDEVVCTPNVFFPSFAATLDARQSLANFVHNIPVSNQQQLSQQQIVKFSKFNPKNHVLNQDQKHLVGQNLSQTQLLATISLPQATLQQQQQQIQHTHLLQPVSHADINNELLNSSKNQQSAKDGHNNNNGGGGHNAQNNNNNNNNGNNTNTNTTSAQNTNTASGNTTVIWACPSCKVPFKTASELQSHLSSHTKSDKNVPCEQCGKMFVSAERVKIHVKVAHGAKSANCHICGSSFSYKCKLTDHMRTHTGDKPFQCEICGRKFSQKNHVRRHKMIHTGERPFPCDICGRGFYRKDKLTRHRLIHTNPSSRKTKQSNASTAAQSSARTTQTVEMSVATSRPLTLNNDTITMQNVTQHFGQGNATIPLIPVQLTAQQWQLATNSNNLNQNGESLNNKINTTALLNAVST